MQRDHAVLIDPGQQGQAQAAWKAILSWLVLLQQPCSVDYSSDVSDLVRVDAMSG